MELAILTVATAAVVAAGSRLFRKRCPMCGKRAVVAADQARLERAVDRPTLYWRFRCTRCRADFASSDGRTLIPREAWDAGVRGSFDAGARIVKDR